MYGHDFLHITLAAFIDEAGSFSFPHFRKYIIQKSLSISHGVCPSCGHPLAPEFQSNPDLPTHDVDIRYSCDLCGIDWVVSVGRALLADPGLRSFCDDHGIDVLTTPYWELEFAATDKHVTVRSTDPWEVALEVTFDDATLELLVDGDLNVIERNRRGTSRVNEVVLPDKTACLDEIRSHRWPEGVTCPHCTTSDTTRKGTTGKDAQRYRCHQCERIFNDLTGTIFANRHLSLPEMVHIIWELEEPDPARLGRQLDRSTESISDFVNTVRDARDDDAVFDIPAVSKGDEIYSAPGDNL